MYDTLQQTKPGGISGLIGGGDRPGLRRLTPGRQFQPPQMPAQPGSAPNAPPQIQAPTGQTKGTVPGTAPQVTPPPPQAQPPAQAPPQQPPQQPGLNDGRMNIMGNLMQNPQSMGPQVQQQMYASMADQRDAALQDQQRQIRENMAARGIGDSGLSQYMNMQAGLSADSDLNSAMRDIQIAAARQNFSDQMNVANLAHQQQMGFGNQALSYAQLQNQIFDSDRNFRAQQAQSMYGLGAAGQGHQGQLLGGIAGLIGGGQSQQQQQMNRIYQWVANQYADPNVGAVTMQPYAPNPFLDYITAMDVANAGSGGGSPGAAIGSIGGAAIGGLTGGLPGAQLGAGVGGSVGALF